MDVSKTFKLLPHEPAELAHMTCTRVETTSCDITFRTPSSKLSSLIETTMKKDDGNGRKTLRCAPYVISKTLEGKLVSSITETTYNMSIASSDEKLSVFEYTRVPEGCIKRLKELAKEKADEMGTGVPVISLQYKVSGTRKYYVTSWNAFFDRILPDFCRRKKELCFFENIYGNETTPCRLYVDIERPMTSFAQDHRKIMQNVFDLYDAIVGVLFHTFRTNPDDVGRETVTTASFIRKVEAIVMDASSEKKFSVHLVIRIYAKKHGATGRKDDVRFKSSYDVGRFFSSIRMCSEYLNEKKILSFEKNPFYWDLSTTNDDKKDESSPVWTFIPDQSVYENTVREFRILGSTKTGQSRHLKWFGIWSHEFDNLLYGEHKTIKTVPVVTIGEMTDFDIGDTTFRSNFGGYTPYDTLIQYLDVDAETGDPVVNRVVEWGEISENTGRCFFETRIEKALDNDSFVGNASKRNFETSNDGDGSTRRYGGNAKKKQKTTSFWTNKIDLDRLESMKDEFDEETKKCWESYKDVSNARYVVDVIMRDIKRQKSHLMSHTLYPASFYVSEEDASMCTVSFGTSSKQCDIRGGDHTNNHVYYVASLNNKTWHQGCWNPGCCAKQQEKEKNILQSYKTARSSTAGVDISQFSFDKWVVRSKTSFNDIKSCVAYKRPLGEHTWETINRFLAIQQHMKRVLTGKYVFKRTEDGENAMYTNESEPKTSHSNDTSSVVMVLETSFGKSEGHLSSSSSSSMDEEDEKKTASDHVEKRATINTRQNPIPQMINYSKFLY